MNSLLGLCTIFFSHILIWAALALGTINKLRVPTRHSAGTADKRVPRSSITPDTAVLPSVTSAGETTGNDDDSKPSSTGPLVSPEPEAVQQHKDNGIEEGRDAYHFDGFHPVYVGEIYNSRYKVLSKLGWGLYSTVWLVKDLKSSPEDKTPYRAMKVLSSDPYGGKHDIHELEILRHLRSAMPDAYGYRFICHLLDDFEHFGPNGIHVCLVFEPMGETWGTFIDTFDRRETPSDLMKIFVAQLALAVDYAHHVGVIHCDIKPGSIFVKVRDWSLIESGYLKNLPPQHQDRTKPYEPVRSFPLTYDYYTEEQLNGDLAGFELVLGDFGVASWRGRRLCELIQPRCLRSPEVLIGSIWDESTDYWNLGAVVFEMYRGVRMFNGAGADCRYEVRKHLNEIVHFFGPFPSKLLSEVKSAFAEDHFNQDGTIRGVEVISLGKGLDSVAWMDGLELEDRRGFVKVLRGMMSILPEDRTDVYELLHSSWLKDVTYYVIDRYDLWGEGHRAGIERRANVSSEAQLLGAVETAR